MPTEPVGNPTVPAIIVSDTTAATTSTMKTSSRGSLALVADVSFTFVSFSTGFIPNGIMATVLNTRTGATVSAAMTNGGMHPVRVEAQPGDVLETTVALIGGGTTTLSNTVPARKRPTVVRTIPPRGKTDVPLNSRIQIVFSEPIDSRTVNGTSLRLERGSGTVAGQVVIADAAGLVVDFIPSDLFEANATYQIVVTSDIRDLDGDALDATVTVDFATGTTTALTTVVTDEAALITNPYTGEQRTFEMSAMETQDHSVAGRWTVFYPGTGHRASGPITCMKFGEGGAVWLGGIADETPNRAKVGWAAGWRLVDNGPPTGSMSDQLSLVHSYSPDEWTAEDWCEKMPVFDPFLEEDIELNALQSGNIVIRRPGVVLTPPPVSDMSRIAYAAAPNGGIHVMRADGLGSVALTINQSDWNPAWSPDGSRIAFDRGTGTEMGPDIYVMNADGTGLRRLTSGEWFDANPAWSPDGRKIVFYRNSALYVMNATDGSDPRQLTGDGAHPTWSPNGQQVAFWSGRSGPWGVYAMNADGSGLRRLTSDTMSASNPSWSPDGASIAFQGEQGIYVMNADGSNVRRVALGGQTPAWSRDSKMIVYEWFGLNVINADGSGLLRRGTGFTPAWSPTGVVPSPPQPYISLEIAAGNAQTDTILSVLAPFNLRLVRDDGTPAAGVRVYWRLISDVREDSIAASLSANATMSDASGIAAVSLKLGSVARRLRVLATVTDGSARSSGVEFSATARPGTPRALLRLTPDSLLGVVDSSALYDVFASDKYGNALSGLTIFWTVMSGGGLVTPAEATTATDSSSGYGVPFSRALHSFGSNEGAHQVGAALSVTGVAPIVFTTRVVTKRVTVAWNGFTPDTVTILSGKTVGWEWNPSGEFYDYDLHNVTFEDDPAPPVSSSTFDYGVHMRTFTGSPRTIRYRCTRHSSDFTTGEVGVVRIQ